MTDSCDRAAPVAIDAPGGTISLDGRRIDGMNATQRARLGLRRSFQSLELFEDVSLEENIRAGSDLRASRWSWVTDLFWPGHHDLPSAAVAAVREFELESHLDKAPDELPYGRRRLVGIARWRRGRRSSWSTSPPPASTSTSAPSWRG